MAKAIEESKFQLNSSNIIKQWGVRMSVGVHVKTQFRNWQMGV